MLYASNLFMDQISDQTFLNDQQHPNPKFMDRFIKITDAARILGYASFQSINQMIKNHALNAPLEISLGIIEKSLQSLISHFYLKVHIKEKLTCFLFN